MQALDFVVLVNKVISESKSYGGLEITCNGGFQRITGVEYCEDCSQFHIITEPTEDAKELLNERKGKAG